MELRHLRYFAALAETLSFTRAAERAHVSQSTLSHQIKQLEESVGHQLFDRRGKRIALTERGETFLGSVTRALREVDQCVSALKDPPEKLAGRLRVGATGNFNVEFTPACVASFLDRYPGVRVTVMELPAGSIASRLRSGKLDLGIAYRPIERSELRFEPLYNEQMVLVVSSRHPFAGRKRIHMVELHGQRLVLLPEEFASRKILNESFSACGAAPVVAAEMNTVAPMLGLVARSTIGAMVSPSTELSMRGLCAIPIESPTPMRTPGLLWRKNFSAGPVVMSFAATVRKIAGDRARRLSGGIKTTGVGGGKQGARRRIRAAAQRDSIDAIDDLHDQIAFSSESV